MALIDIGTRNYLLYLVLPHPTKMALLSEASRSRLDAINRLVHETAHSGDDAASYDQIHRYAEAEQHEHPCRTLIEEVWSPEGYGRALDLGGSGYFTTMIAKRATSVIAAEAVGSIHRAIQARCAAEGVNNVEILGTSVFDLRAHVPERSIDSVLIFQSLHHFHRREEVFAALGALVRPGGRLFLVEPHYNIRYVAGLTRAYFANYRRAGFLSDERNWATDDCLTRGEIRSLCRRGGFEEVRLTGYWIPFARRILPDAHRRFRVERLLGSIAGLRHFAALLTVEARRSDRRL